MPYSTPTSSSPDSSSRPAMHRRTRSCSATFSDDKGPGAFVSLGSLPKRKPSAKKSVFHFKDDELESDDPEPPQTPPLFLSLPPSFSGEEGSVPFPSSLLSPLSPSTPGTTPSPPDGARSNIPRTSSSPIILSNGKPLKPSLKSASSSPQIHIAHLRAQSAPATPSITKNVHFADSDNDLETVRVFNRSGKPASIAHGGEDTETETEADNTSYFPYTAASPSPPLDRLSVIDPAVTSPVPNLSSSPYSNIHIESMAFPKSRPAVLHGSILVRNIAFEKQVALRFTLDDWQTTSEVLCKYVMSLPSLPQPFPRTRTVGDVVGLLAASGDASPSAGLDSTWDRFSFTVQLEHYEHKLPEQTIWFVGRFTCPVGEWWDNNNGMNYRLGFKRPHISPNSPSSDLQASVPHAQQKSFTVPSTMRTTPVTAKVDVQTSVLPFPTFSPGTQGSTNSPPLLVSTPVSATPYSMPHTAPPRSNPPPVKFLPSGLAERRGIRGGVKLSPTIGKMNLTNYAAPASVTVVSPTQTPTPPRSRSGSLEDASPGSKKSIPKGSATMPSRPPTSRNGSPMLTSPRSSPPRISSPHPAMSSSTSSSTTPKNAQPVLSSWSSPTASTLPTPPGFLPSTLEQLSPLLTTSELPSAALRAALVKQWCFAQSTPPTPGVFDTVSAGSSDASPAASEELVVPISSGNSSSDGERELMDVLSPTSGNGSRFAWWVGGGSTDNNRSGSVGGWLNWSGSEPPMPFWGAGATRTRTDARVHMPPGPGVGVEG